jgi:Tol biopolymer transport system component
LLVDSTGASERVLVQPRWNFIDDVAWLDSENLIFIGYEDEWSNEIFTINIRSGEVRQLTDDLQNYRYLAVNDREILTIQSNAVSGIYEADFEENVKEIQPREIFRESGYISNVALGKDGAIFYSSRSTGAPEIWRIDADGTNPTPLTSGSNINFGLAVSPSDDSLVYSSYENGKYTLRAVDGSGKNPRPVTDGVDHITPEVSVDGKIVFQSFSQKILRISANEKTPVELSNGLKPVLSPDGRQTAFFAMDEKRWRIILISTGTGETLKKLDFPTVVNQRRMRWHPSGKFLTLFFNTGENLKLLLLPVEDGEPRIIEGFGTGDLNSFGWTEDGKKLIYSVTKETRDAVLLSGF